MARKTKNDIIKDLLQELNAVKSFYGITDVSEAEQQAQTIVDKSEPVIDYENLQTKFYYTLEEYKELVKNNKLPPMSYALAVTVLKDRKNEYEKHDTFVHEQGYWDYDENVDDGFYNGIRDWFGSDMKPIGIVVNDCVSVQDAMREAKSTITRDGINCVSVRLHCGEEQLRYNPVNKKAQADFLKRMGYEKKY